MHVCVRPYNPVYHKKEMINHIIEMVMYMRASETMLVLNLVVQWCSTGFASGPEFLLDIIWQPTTTPKLFIIQNLISMVSCFRQPIIHCTKLIMVVTNHVPCIHVVWIIFYLLCAVLFMHLESKSMSRSLSVLASS